MSAYSRAAEVLAELVRAADLAPGPEAELLGAGWAGRLREDGLLRADEHDRDDAIARVLVMSAAGVLVHILDPAGPRLGAGALGGPAARALCGRTPVYGTGRAQRPPGGVAAGGIEPTCNRCLNRAAPGEPPPDGAP